MPTSEGASMPVTPDQAGPYAPAAVIVDLIERHRNKGLPTPITVDVLARAGVSDSLLARTLQALSTLDLIDSEGRPTAALEEMRLAPEAEFLTRMGQWLSSTYADALQFVNPATDDEGAVRDAFRKYNPVGQQGRMVTLFMGLFRRAGIAPDKTPTGGAAKRKKSNTINGKPQKPLAKPAVSGGTLGKDSGGDNGKPDPSSDGATNQDNSKPEYMAALLDKFPTFDPSWPDDIKAKWFDGFQVFMKGVAPK